MNKPGFDFIAYYTEAKVAELGAAFAKVTPKDNWKVAIDAVVPSISLDEAAVISEAITFYTGSVATVTPVGDGFRFVAAGYYAAIGA